MIAAIRTEEPVEIKKLWQIERSDTKKICMYETTALEEIER